MHISDTYKCNLMNLGTLARYLDVGPEILIGYYEELRSDADFLTAVNDRIAAVRRDYGFDKGIFRMGQVPSVDWFAFERVLIYVLIRHLRPRFVLETGVYYGGNTAFLLNGLAKNGEGRLVSVDFPDATIRSIGASAGRHPLVGDSELYTEALRPGFMVPGHLQDRWELVEGDSLQVIPQRNELFDLYMHDSDHSMPFLRQELEHAKQRLAPDATIVVDDIDWSNAFYEFCVKEQLYPLLLTDNGKDDLRVRTGVAQLKHPRNRMPAITGAVQA